MVTDELIKNVTEAWGRAGAIWLDRLPSLVAEIAEREPWLAIDPKGVVGDPAYELGPFIYSLALPHEQPARVLTRRLDQFAEELGFDRERIMNAVLPRAVLAAWPEGATEIWHRPLDCAKLLNELTERQSILPYSPSITT